MNRFKEEVMINGAKKRDAKDDAIIITTTYNTCEIDIVTCVLFSLLSSQLVKTIECN